MGLDTSHDCWHGPYSSFSAWRNKLGVMAGYELATHKRPYGDLVTIKVDWDELPEDAVDGVWPETPEDPLMVLLAHSDCDGKIYPPQLMPLADRLGELYKQLPDEPGDFDNMKYLTRRFISGLQLAAALDEPVEFH